MSTTENKQRDLHADLAICNAATSGPWIETDGGYVIVLDGTRPEGRGDFIAECDNIENARFIEVARDAWPHAIERALKAEARVIELEAAVREVDKTAAKYDVTLEDEDCDRFWRAVTNLRYKIILTRQREGICQCVHCGNEYKRGASVYMDSCPSCTDESDEFDDEYAGGAA